MMKKLYYPVAGLLIIGASAFTVMRAQSWKPTEDYSVKFTSDDPSGVFRGLKGVINFDEKDLANSNFDVTIDVATINTGNGMKNTHAKSAQWLDAEKYPVIRFTSSSIAAAGSGYEAKGVLEMHGVKKDFVMPFAFAKSDNGGTFASSFSINRLDFDVHKAAPAHGAATLKVDLSVPVTR